MSAAPGTTGARAPLAPPTPSAPPLPPLEARSCAGLSAVAAADWDALVRTGAGPLRHAFLGAATRIELPAFEFRPLVVSATDGAGGFAAHAPACHYDLDYAQFATGRAASLLASVRSLSRRFLVLRVFEIGCPVALCEPFSIAPEADADAAVDALGRAAIDEAERSGAELVIAHDFVPGQRGTAPAVLGRLGFEPVPLLPNFVLDLDARFDTFGAYLAAMRSPYRRRARARLQQASALRPELATSIGNEASELARLWRSIYDRASENRREILPEAFFRAIDGMPHVRVLSLRRPDGSIASFALLYEDGGTLRFLYSGLKIEAREEGAYFRLLYEIVRVAIEGRFARVDLGWTTAGPKLDLGARIVPLEAWIRHRHRGHQRALAWATRHLLRWRALEPRRVFR